MNLRRTEGTQPPLSKRAMNAASWRFAASAVSAVVSFGIHVWLARLLPPSDFGLVAMAFLFTGLARIVSNLGLPAAIVQRSDLTEEHVRTAFTISWLLGLAVTLALIVLAPLSTLVFPEPRLPSILRALALVFLFTGVGNTAGALLRRFLDFKRIFWVTIIGYVGGFGGVAIPLALAGFGVWSLVLGTVSHSIVETTLLLVLVRHPVRPLIGRRQARELAGYGVGFSLSEILKFGARGGDNFVIGRWLGGGPLGLYTKAYGLMRLPADYLGEVLNAVLLPAFAELQQERERLASAYLRSTELAVLLSAPILAGMVVAAPHMIVGLLGPNWKGSIIPLQILGLVGVLSTGYPISTTVANALGRVYAVSLRTGIFAIVVVLSGYLALPWGIVGVSVAVTAAHLLMYYLMSGLALRSLGVSWASFGRAHVPGALLAAEVGTSALIGRWLLERAGLSSIAILLALIGICAITLYAGLRTFPARVRPDPLLSVLRDSLPRFPAFIQRVLNTILTQNGNGDSEASGPMGRD
jgi:PST family polysaccharide transporter